jgi:protein gp37
MGKILWTDATWNPVVGCSHVSAGCQNCYAERQAVRLARMHAPALEKYRLVVRDNQWSGAACADAAALTKPLTWRRPRRIFVCSMGDLFHHGVSRCTINTLFAIMALAPQHTYQVLTKRPSRAYQYLSDPHARERVIMRAGQIAWTQWHITADTKALRDAIQWPMPHVWLGVSAENQLLARERITTLLHCPAALRWVSVEPMLGPVNLAPWLPSVETLGPSLDWVVCGGESGPHARPLHPDWVRRLRDDCKRAAVPFLLKQWGEWIAYEEQGQPPLLHSQNGHRINAHELPPDLDYLNDAQGWHWDHLNPYDHTTPMLYRRVGRKSAGRQLDGRTHEEYPEGSINV